jgi:hypothetical protein
MLASAKTWVNADEGGARATMIKLQEQDAVPVLHQTYPGSVVDHKLQGKDLPNSREFYEKRSDLNSVNFAGELQCS